MRVAIGLRLEPTRTGQQAAAYVVEAERLGVDCVWSHESWGLDAATPLAFMAARTSRIRLGSGIMQAGTRTPALHRHDGDEPGLDVGRPLRARASA